MGIKSTNNQQIATTAPTETVSLNHELEQSVNLMGGLRVSVLLHFSRQFQFKLKAGTSDYVAVSAIHIFSFARLIVKG